MCPEAGFEMTEVRIARSIRTSVKEPAHPAACEWYGSRKELRE